MKNIRSYYFHALLLVGSLGLAQQSYTFTTANNTGSLGPSQSQVTLAYSATNLNGSVTVTGGIQSFTIPTSGLYELDITGASGGNPANYATRKGGFGARIIGEFNLVAGDVLKILVGQKGGNGTGGSGGGGGTYVTLNNTLIIAAGGGGGATSDNNAANASLTTSGTNDFPGGTIPGGTNGMGGSACNIAGGGANHGGGGAGYLGNGATSTAPTPGGGGVAFVNGGTGGAGGTAGAWGGFGGGGGATQTTVGGGGGGGYSGGAGGQQVNYCTPGINRSGGGGGGSYNIGANQQSSVLSVQGDGRVILTSLCNISLQAATNPICEGNSVTLSTDAASGILWSTGAVTSSIVVSPTVTTTYSVTGTSTANCNASSKIVVVVNPLPQVSALSSPSVICAGNDGTLTAFGAQSYTWNGAQTGSQVVISPAVAGSYTVVGASAAGCTVEAVTALNTNTNTLTLTSNTQVCEGRPVTLSATGAVSYTWNTGAIFSTIQFTTASPGTYSVKATDEHNCELTGNVSVGILSNPTVTTKATPGSICKGEMATIEAEGATSYIWNTGSSAPSFTINPFADVTLHFTVTGTDNNGCVDQSVVSVVVNKCVGISELNKENKKATFFPNPTSGLVTIRLAEHSPGMKLTVYDALGSMVLMQELNNDQAQIDISTFAKGLYHFIIQHAQNEISSSIIFKE